MVHICTYIHTLFQEAESTGEQALQNVVMLVDLISSTLVTDTDSNVSITFSEHAEFISECLNFSFVSLIFI